MPASPPLSLRRLDDVERRIKEMMFKQVMAKGRQMEAQEEMRRMLATFVERLSQMTESTSAHHQKMEESARKIEQAKSLEDIGPVMKEVVSTTRSIAMEISNTHQELRSMREKVNATQAEIARLQHELDTASTQARHDTLTGALNRKGLDEALVREIADGGRWTLPGGWCDVGLSPGENVVKEVFEESGFHVEVERLVAALDLYRQSARSCSPCAD